MLPWVKWIPRHRTAHIVVPWRIWLFTFVSDSDGVFVRVAGLELFWRRLTRRL
jgi:hypothetical protein